MNTTKKTDESETDDIQVITDEIARLRSDMSGLVEKLGRAGRSRAEGLAEEAKVKLGEQQARGEEMLHEIDADLRRLEDNILKSTRDNPVRALGIAAAVGFFLALIIRR